MEQLWKAAVIVTCVIKRGETSHLLQEIFGRNIFSFLLEIT